MTDKNEAICCGNFEKMLSAFGWFSFADVPSDKLVMPYIEAGGTKWRVNNCPSCGAHVRSVEITKEQFKNSEL